MFDYFRDAIESGDFIRETVERFPYEGDHKMLARASREYTYDITAREDVPIEKVEMHALQLAVLRVMEARGEF